MTGLRYLGQGEFIPGVPARDLSEDEAHRFRATIDEHRSNTGRALYGDLAAEPAEQVTEHTNPAEPKAAEAVKGEGRPRGRREQPHGE